ncbi:hypothetical protein M758_6G084700 [Ceratodon purpureus]|nr:hypothetical protein M758_6G084700 [Ceratodon purpureus]
MEGQQMRSKQHFLWSCSSGLVEGRLSQMLIMEEVQVLLFDNFHNCSDFCVSAFRHFEHFSLSSHF